MGVGDTIKFLGLLALGLGGFVWINYFMATSLHNIVRVSHMPTHMCQITSAPQAFRIWKCECQYDATCVAADNTTSPVIFHYPGTGKYCRLSCGDYHVNDLVPSRWQEHSGDAYHVEKSVLVGFKMGAIIFGFVVEGCFFLFLVGLCCKSAVYTRLK